MKRGALPLRGLMFIALLAALGMVAKPILGPLVHLLTGFLLIPGGVIAGGVYMLFPVLAAAVNSRNVPGRVPLAGTLCALVQALVVMATGMFGFHGIMSLVTYTAPGIAIDLVFWIFALCKTRTALYPCFAAGALSNVAGTYAVNWLFFSLPLMPLLLSLFVALLSGGLGGVAASFTWSKLKKLPMFVGR